ncbi:MAG: putative glycoside hydrolase family 15 protein, partial [Armatimonadetes bacterium]|nr:putative glycoside hydrolase family 15 protein [Armatimonadota bacterium]
WYPEYDAPLGKPLGPARRRPDGLWERAFEGGLVVVNGTAYDAIVETDRKYRDFSSGHVGQRFLLRMYDGKILVPTDEPETSEPEAPPRITLTPPPTVRLAQLDDGITAVQTPAGLDLRFGPNGELQRILLHGRPVMTGGWPAAAAQPWKEFSPQQVAREQSASETQANLRFTGMLVQEDQRVAFQEQVIVDEGNHFVLQFDFEAKTDLNLRMWRHYFFLPVSKYAGASVETDGTTLLLPEEHAENELAGNIRRLRVETGDVAIDIESSVPASLVDHRKWGTQDYLLAAYPVGGAVSRGSKWQYQVEVWIRGRGR